MKKIIILSILFLLMFFGCEMFGPDTSDPDDPADVVMEITLDLTGTADGTPYSQAAALSDDTLTASFDVAHELERITVTLSSIPLGLTVRIDETAMSTGVPLNIDLAVGLNTITVDLVPDGGETVHCTLSINRAAATTDPDPDPLEFSGTNYCWIPDQSMHIRSIVTDTTVDSSTFSGSWTNHADIVEYNNDDNWMVLTWDEGDTAVYAYQTWTEPAGGVCEVTQYSTEATIAAAKDATTVGSFSVNYNDAALVPPVIILNGNATVVISAGEEYTDPEAVVKDWGVDDVEISASNNGGLDLSDPVEGNYTLTYTYTDTDQNGAVPVTRSVTVTEIAEPLELIDFYYSHLPSEGYYKQTQTNTSYNLVNNSETQVDYGSIYEYDNDTNEMLVFSQVVFDDGGAPYYRCGWTAPDSDGNFTFSYSAGCATLEAARTATVDDTVVPAYTDVTEIPPILVLNGDNPMDYTDTATTPDPGATVKDWPDDSIVYVDITALDSLFGGTKTLTYEYSDGDGNAAAPVSRTVNLPQNLTGDITQLIPDDWSELVTPYSGMAGETFHLVARDTDDSVTVLSNNTGTGATLDFTPGVPDIQSINHIMEDEALTYSNPEAEVLFAEVIRRDSFGAESGMVVTGDFSGYGSSQLYFYYYFYSTADTTVTGTGAESERIFDNLQLAVGWNRAQVYFDGENLTVTNTTITDPDWTVIEMPVEPEITDMYMYEDSYNHCYVHFSIDDNDWSVVQEEGGDDMDNGYLLRCDNAANEMILYSDVQECYIKLTWTDPAPVTTEGVYTNYQGHSSYSDALNASSGGLVLTYYTDPVKVPPVIILDGDNPDTVAVDGTYTDPGATVRDWGVAETTINADTPWGWDTSSSETYQLYYNHEDADHNHAEQVIREVAVGSGSAEIIIY